MSIQKYISVLAIFMLANTGAQAALVDSTITQADCSASGTDYIIDSTCWTSNSNPALTLSEVEALVGDSPLDELYKDDQGGSESGAFADSYSTQYFNTPTDPEDATISYTTGGNVMDCITDSCYLLVKDGNEDPSQYIFDITGWNGTTALVLFDFWTGSGAISHVTLYGTLAVVPLPAAFWLFGTALIGFIGVSRRTAV